MSAERSNYRPEFYRGESGSEKPKYSKVAKRMAAALVAVLAIGGLMRHEEVDLVPVNDRQEQSTHRDKNIDVKNIKVGEYVDYQEGVYELDSTKLNIRSGPFIDHDTDNKLEIASKSDHIYVSNPVYVQSDANGDWFEAVDANGREIYMVGNAGGITDVITGEEASLSDYGLKSAEVLATTNRGNAGRGEDGENILLATIEKVN